MNKSDLRKIEEKIGYKFNKIMLLNQAFTRRSYSKENGGKNNELLEFFGDKVLDYIIVKKISEYYGDLSEDNEYCTFNGETEGDLTKIKKNLVESSMLAQKITILGLEEYLIMGKGDIKKNIQNEQHVKEDLFEAIIGAVALDTNWNENILEKVVENMLDVDYYFKHGFDNNKNYTELVQQWFQKKYGKIPEYSYRMGDDGVYCELYLSELGEKFSASGSNKSDARYNTAKKVYGYLEENDLLFSMADEVGEPDYDMAINQLQELYQKGYIAEPVYNYYQDHDKYGPTWACACEVNDYGSFATERTTKRDAKKSSAYAMLKIIMYGEYNGFDV